MNNQIEQCFAHAREAEEHASRTTEAYIRESWLGIANSYRQLAEVRLERLADGAPQVR